MSRSQAPPGNTSGQGSGRALLLHDLMLCSSDHCIHGNEPSAYLLQQCVYRFLQHMLPSNEESRDGWVCSCFAVSRGDHETCGRNSQTIPGRASIVPSVDWSPIDNKPVASQCRSPGRGNVAASTCENMLHPFVLVIV